MEKVYSLHGKCGAQRNAKGSSLTEGSKGDAPVEHYAGKGEQ